MYNEIEEYIRELEDPQTRERALQGLCSLKYITSNYALLLWLTPGVVTILIEEISSYYSIIESPSLPVDKVHRCILSIRLLEIIASHPQIRREVIREHIPIVLYQVLHVPHWIPENDHVRRASLRVIHAMIKVNRRHSIPYLVSNNFIPLCLHNLESYEVAIKMYAIYILHEILLHKRGVRYVCRTYERFSDVAFILGRIVNDMVGQPIWPILKHVIFCYLSISKTPRGCAALRPCIPDVILEAENIFTEHDLEINDVKFFLMELRNNLNSN